jgi:thymidylate synthase
MKTILAKNALDLWKDLLNKCIEGDKVNSTFPTYELHNVVVTLSPPHTAIRDPIKVLSTQHDWIYPDETEIKQAILEKNNSPYYRYSYANRIFNYNQDNIDQVHGFIIPLLKKDPLTRKAVLTLTNPAQENDPSNDFIPGLTQIQFEIRHGKLHTTAIIRSCDIFLGWPANIYQIFSISEYVSEKLGLSLGNISTICLNAHIYDHMLSHMKRYLK